MYCRVFEYQFRPGDGVAIRDLARHAHEIMKQQAGFHSATFFADEEKGKGGAISLWETREAIEGYIKGSSGLMRAASAGLFLGSPKSMVAEVFETGL
jgi:heme-degrading monooxygenase HmoA